MTALPSTRKIKSRAIMASVLSCCLVGSGCAVQNAREPAAVDPASPVQDLSGNWQFSLQSSSQNGSPSNILAGSITEELTSASDHFVSATLELIPGCVQTSSIFPLDGQVAGSRMQMSALQVNNQLLSMDMTASSDGNALGGTFTTSGSCSVQQSGTVSGVRYQEFSGTYIGQLHDGSSGTITMVVSQNSFAGGKGEFALTGEVYWAGSRCSGTGTLAQGSSFVRGEAVTINSDPNSPSTTTLQVAGTLNPAATSITVHNITMADNICEAAYQNTTLYKQ